MEIINKEKFEELKASEKILFVDFYADWCGPCKMMAPILEDVEKEYQGVKFVKINVDEEPGLAQQFNIMSIPTIKIFIDGKEKHDFVGFTSKSSLQSFLNITA